jgi:hypothetical protein
MECLWLASHLAEKDRKVSDEIRGLGSNRLSVGHGPDAVLAIHMKDDDGPVTVRLIVLAAILFWLVVALFFLFYGCSTLPAHVEFSDDQCRLLRQRHVNTTLLCKQPGNATSSAASEEAGNGSGNSGGNDGGNGSSGPAGPGGPAGPAGSSGQPGSPGSPGAPGTPGVPGSPGSPGKDNSRPDSPGHPGTGNNPGQGHGKGGSKGGK